MMFEKRKMGLLLALSVLFVLMLVACNVGEPDGESPSTPLENQTTVFADSTSADSEPDETVVSLIQYDVFDNFHVSFSGVTGYGAVTVEMSDTIPEEIADNLEFSVSSTEDVSNGDKIIVTLQYDPNIIKKNGYQIIGDSFQYTVYGLKELTEIDPFDGLVLNYSGISPFCSVNFNNANCNKEAQKYVSYTWIKSCLQMGILLWFMPRLMKALRERQVA